MIIEDETWSYHATLKGENCLDDQIISEEKECIIASQKLGSNYVGRATSSKRPAGCYWVIKSLSGKDHSFSYLNTILDPKDVSPSNGREQGGICKTMNVMQYEGQC